jgi:tetratricopeptide (TPR) repeat protein
VLYSGNNSIYLIPKGYSKGRSLELLIKKLNINKEDICVFGDSEADFSLYSKIRNSVLVGNANPLVKECVIKEYPNIYISNKKYAEGVLEGLSFWEKKAHKIFNKNLSKYRNLYKSSNFDQIKKEVTTNVESKDMKIQILNSLTLGDVCEKQGLFRKAKKHFLKAEKLIGKLCDYDLQSLIKIQIARNHVSLGELDKGIKILKEIKIRDENSDLKRYAMNGLAYAYRVQGKNKEAEKILNGLNNGQLNTGIDLSIAHNLAGLYRELERYEESLNLYKKILNKTDQSNIFAIAKLYNNIGFIYRKTCKYSLAEKYYLKSYQMEKQIGSKQLQGRTLNNLGGICRMKKRYKDALSYFNDSAHIRSSIGDSSGLSSSLLNKGIVLREMGKMRAAKRVLKESYNIRKRTGSEKLISEVKLELKKL